MVNSLIKALPMLISMIISQFIYLKMDDKYNITNRISSRLPIRKELKAAFFTCGSLISMLIIGVISIYIINIPDTLYLIIIGTLTGVCIDVSAKLSTKKVL